MARDKPEMASSTMVGGDAFGAGDSELLMPTWTDVEDAVMHSRTLEGQVLSHRCMQTNSVDRALGEVEEVDENTDGIPSKGSRKLFHLIKREVQWQTMYHASGEVPRRVCAQGETQEFSGSPPEPQAGDTSRLPKLSEDPQDSTTTTGHPLYRHPSDHSLPLDSYTPTVDLIRRKVEGLIEQQLNHCLIQLYRTGQDFISEHSDKTLDVERGSRIVNVSLGAQRKMRLRTKRAPRDSARVSGGSIEGDTSAVNCKENQGSTAQPSLPQSPPTTLPGAKRTTQQIPLPHGSVFILGPRTNARFLHGINPDRRPAHERSAAETAPWCAGERISLTFRSVKTWTDDDEQWIWGQGARGQRQQGKGQAWKETTLNEAGRTIKGDETETARLIDMFGRENQDVGEMFDWEGVYGEGSDVLHFRMPSSSTS